MEFIQIEVEQRHERGSAAMRRLRLRGQLPAVLYGLDRQTLALTIPTGELERFLRTGSHLVELTMGDESRDAIVREVQLDPVTEAVLHVDFQRVDKSAAVEDNVRVLYKGVAPGTSEGGLFQGLLDTLHVRARPRDLPEEIVLDIGQLHVGDAIHVRDVKVPDGVTLLDPPDELIAHVVAMRGRTVAEESEVAGAAPEAAEAGAPAQEPDAGER